MYSWDKQAGLYVLMCSTVDNEDDGVAAMASDSDCRFDFFSLVVK